MSTFNEGLGIMRRIQKEEFMGISTSAAENISSISYTMYNISTSVAATAIYSIYGHKYFCNIQVPYKYCTICNIQA